MVCREDGAIHFSKVHSRHKLQQARMVEIRKENLPGEGGQTAQQVPRGCEISILGENPFPPEPAPSNLT